MAKAIEIVQRYQARDGVMPREWREHSHDPVRAEVRATSPLHNLSPLNLSTSLSSQPLSLFLVFLCVSVCLCGLLFVYIHATST